MLYQKKLRFSTSGRGTYNISNQITEAVEKSGIKSGICHLFIQHTSASLILCENADRTVREDLDNYMTKLVKDGDSLYKHNDEGPDDMAAHIRTILTQSS
jgi:secondary thiamine-phosphate synthase enzyme